MKGSRNNEYEADRFSYEIGYGTSLASALDRIAGGASEGHGLFANLASSHPDTDSRIARLQQYEEEKNNRQYQVEVYSQQLYQPLETYAQVQPQPKAVNNAPQYINIKPQIDKLGHIVCLSGEYRGARFQINHDEIILVGRDPKVANIIQSNPTVSRKQFYIRYNGIKNTYYIKDNSSNGTYVNDNRIPRNHVIEIPCGSKITFGQNKEVYVLAG